MQKYKDYLLQLADCLEAMEVTSNKGSALTQDEGIDKWCKLTYELKSKKQKMYLVGNGASAMMASHMAADASKNGGFRAIAFNDPALLTAVSNDLAYDQSFALPLKRFADPDDLLLTISSSGNSPNIVASIAAAKEMGLKIITLSGMKPGNKSRSLGDLNFYIPAETYGLVEAAHQALLHCWLDLFMEEYPEEVK